MKNPLSKIPIHFRPFKAKAEIARLKQIADSRAPHVDALKNELENERAASSELGMELDRVNSKLLDSQALTSDLTKELAATKAKLESLTRWISATHGLAGLRTAGGKTVDILKLNKKNENKITVSVPHPAPGASAAGG